MKDLIPQLRSAVGAANVLTDGDLSAYEMDWRRRAGQGPGRGAARLHRGSRGGGARLRRAGTPIVPQGGNTGMVVGSTPDDRAARWC